MDVESALPPHHIFSLPQELFDLILSFAYPSTSEPLMAKTLWTKREEREVRYRIGEGYTPKFYPGSVVTDMLVCKKWFVDASKIWTSQQVWRMEERLHCNWGRFQYYDWLCNGLVQEYAREVRDVPATAFKRLHVMKNLKVAEIGFHDHLGLHPELMWEHGCDYTFIGKAIGGGLGFLHWEDLENVRVEVFPHGREESNSRNGGKVRQGMEWIVEYQRENGILPRSQEEKEQEKDERRGTRGTPIYWRSRVCVDRNELLPEDYHVQRGAGFDEQHLFDVNEKYALPENLLKRKPLPPPPKFWDQFGKSFEPFVRPEKHWNWILEVREVLEEYARHYKFPLEEDEVAERVGKEGIVPPVVWGYDLRNPKENPWLRDNREVVEDHWEWVSQAREVMAGHKWQREQRVGLVELEFLSNDL